MSERPSTPPRTTRSAASRDAEQIRRMEEARLKAKAAAQQVATSKPSPAPIAGTKRSYSSINPSNTPQTLRDAASPQKRDKNGFIQPRDNDLIQPAKNFGRSEYIEYDFSKMKDTKGGFLSTEDDPHNRAMWSGRNKEEEKPEGMTLAEWERERVRRKLRDNREGPFQPSISILNATNELEEAEIAAAEAEALGEGQEYKGKYGDGKRDVKGKCRECNSLEVDWKWQDVFGVGVCKACKDKIPEKYSLLTKTEAREDYLLTDPELRDEELLPHLEKPNPHKFYNNMQLFLRLQVEAYAFSDKKWGSPEALDIEYEKRQKVAKERKEKKFKNKLDELKKRTRVEAYKRARILGDAGADVQFGDRIKGIGDKHVHEWGRSTLDPESGMTKKRCEDCGMEVEELVF